MARRTKITIETASNLVVVQDYETATGQIYQMKAGGFGEYTMAQYANVDLTNSESMIALIHSDGTTFQAVAIESIESVTINGVDATITNLSLVRDAVAPYFFNVGRGGYAFYKEITITSAELLNNLNWGGGANPFIVLPAITNGYYPRWVAVHENHFGGAAYTNVSPAGFWSQVPASGTATLLVSLPVTAMNYAWDRVIPNIQPQMNISNVMPIHGLGEQIIFKLLNSTNQTGGNGYVVLKIWYDTEIFG